MTGNVRALVGGRLMVRVTTPSETSYSNSGDAIGPPPVRNIRWYTWSLCCTVRRRQGIRYSSFDFCTRQGVPDAEGHHSPPPPDRPELALPASRDADGRARGDLPHRGVPAPLDRLAGHPAPHLASDVLRDRAVPGRARSRRARPDHAPHGPGSPRPPRRDRRPPRPGRGVLRRRRHRAAADVTPLQRGRRTPALRPAAPRRPL